MDIFAGLEKLGLGNIDIGDVYAEPEKKQDIPDLEQAKKQEVREEDILFDKKYTCPVCDKVFISKTVRAGKIRIVSTDEDLKPRYNCMEPAKYEPIVCTHCGYAVTSKYYAMLASSQKAIIKEKISANYKPAEYTGATYSFEESLERYQLALVCSIVKISESSEKAYTCLKAGWLARSYAESLEENSEDAQKIQQIRNMEDEFLKKAYEGYITALEQESLPISDMDEYTVKYLIASLAKRFKHYDVSAKMIASLLTSRTCPSRIKDKARDMKDELLKDMKDNKQ